MEPDLESVGSEVGRRQRGLRLLVLHRSRARGDAHDDSDWDFGHLGDGPFDHLALIGDLVALLGTDAVDVVDLNQASALLRFKAAAEGRRLFQRARDHEAFVLEATRFWCDAEAVIRRAGDGVLAGLVR